MKRMTRLIVAVLALVLAGCSALGPGDTQGVGYYVLKDLQADRLEQRPAASESGPTANIVLMLGGVSAAALHDSDRIVYTRDGAAHSYYQFAHWSERPGKRLAVLTEQRLARSGRFAAVVQSVSGVKADWLLNLRLDELTHDARQSPGVVRLRLSAEMVDWRHRKLIARQSFVQDIEVPTQDAPGAARAASEAMTRQLDELQAWASALR
ncbi:MAG: ABC-type transport auxiliary lipoprotein family protein [Burkholderiales bacterium]